MKRTPQDVQAWLRSPLGATLRELESAMLASVLEQVFGLQLVQVGLWGEPGLFLKSARTSRAALFDLNGGSGVAVRCDPCTLPITKSCVDAVLLPHVLELHTQPHEVLREAVRVLAGEGHLIVVGFNPYGPWGVRRMLSRGRFPPGIQQFISEGRLRDWLALLGFEVLQVERYCFRLPLPGRGGEKSSRSEQLGVRYWPRLSGAYMMLAKKRVYTLTPIRPLRKKTRVVAGGLVEPTTRSGECLREGRWR